MKAFQMFMCLIIMLAVVQADTCGGNCPSNECSDCKCGLTESMVDITQICAKAGWNQQCCQCIVRKASGGNFHSQKLQKQDGTVDVGLFQINQVNWPSCNGGHPPCDVGQNLECAKKIYGWGKNTWHFWPTCGECGCCNSN